jgi:hypothetical protein
MADCLCAATGTTIESRSCLHKLSPHRASLRQRRKETMRHLRYRLGAVVLVVLAVFSVGSAFADENRDPNPKTGYDLYHCLTTKGGRSNTKDSVQDLWETAYCAGYLTGFVQGIFSVARISPDLACLSNFKFQMGQISLIFQRFAEQHPSMLNRSPMEVLSFALAEAYPCERQ